MHCKLISAALLNCAVSFFGFGAARAASWTLVDIDASDYTGAENAIYARNTNTLYVAYKQFLAPPSSGHTPAAVKLAKSTDGGQSWELSYIDLDAPQIGDLSEQSVSISGVNETVYVAYYVEPTGLFASHQLRVAKSSDAGASWSITTLVNGFAGAFNSTKVVDENNVFISFSAEGGASGLYIAYTHDGGASWSARLIEPDLGNGWYSSVDAVDPQTIFFRYYDGLWPDRVDLNFGASTDSLSTVNYRALEHVPGSYLGLGSAISAVGSSTIYVS